MSTDTKPPLGPRPDHILGKSHVQLAIQDAAQCRDEISTLAGSLMQIAMRVKAEGKPEAAAYDESARKAEALAQRITVAIHEATRVTQKDPAVPALPKPAPGERWRHFKGHIYRIEDIGLDCDTLEEVVIYLDVVDGRIMKRWVRPLSQWHDAEPKMGGRRRFEKVETP